MQRNRLFRAALYDFGGGIFRCETKASKLQILKNIFLRTVSDHFDHLWKGRGNQYKKCRVAILTTLQKQWDHFDHIVERAGTPLNVLATYQ